MSASSDTHVQLTEKNAAKPPAGSLPPASERAESGLPPKKAEEDVDSLEDWEVDPANARNWGFGKKWRAVAIVSLACTHTTIFSCPFA